MRVRKKPLMSFAKTAAIDYRVAHPPELMTPSSGALGNRGTMEHMRA